MKPAATASVVMCVYTADRWDTIVRSVSEVVAQLRPRDELVVVVDHNDDLLRRASAEFDDIAVIPNAETRGLSGARNTGVAFATCDIVVFIDDDAVPHSGWLDALREPYSEESVQGVGGVAEANWLSSRPRWFPDEFAWVVGCSYRGLPVMRSPVRNFIGANMSFRRSAFGLVGGFSTSLGRVGTLPMGCEETELAIRVRQATPTALLLHQPAARVAHSVPAVRGHFRYFVRRCVAEGRSKAQVSKMVGRSDALSSERTYVTQVLPAAVLRGVGQFVRGDVFGLARAGAVCAGLLATTAGYVLVSA